MQHFKLLACRLISELYRKAGNVLREVILRLPALLITNWVTENAVSSTFKRIEEATCVVA